MPTVGAQSAAVNFSRNGKLFQSLASSTVYMSCSRLKLSTPGVPLRPSPVWLKRLYMVTYFLSITVPSGRVRSSVATG